MTESSSPGYQGGAGHTDGRDRFFGWLRTLDIRRGNGWAGGVCAGIATRLGIDPLIVRGVAVVAALLGAPALLVYAVAWALLPDEGGHIHFEDVLHGRVTPPAIGIGLIVLFSFLPIWQGVWWLHAPFDGGGIWPLSMISTLWTLLVIAGIVVLIIWLVRSAKVYRDAGMPAQPWAPTSDSSAGRPAATDASWTASAWAASPSTPSGAPAAGAGTTDAGPAPAGDAQWRAAQDDWRARQAAWAAQQEQARAARKQRSAQVRAQSAAMSAQYQADRRARQAANPRTGGAFIGLAVGIALLAGGIAGWIAWMGAAAPYTGTIGLAAAGAVFGIAMIVAGILRRRSGFLAFLAIVLLGCALLSAVPARNGIGLPFDGIHFAAELPVAAPAPAAV